MKSIMMVVFLSAYNGGSAINTDLGFTSMEACMIAAARIRATNVGTSATASAVCVQNWVDQTGSKQ